jgi:hypothetical protein
MHRPCGYLFRSGERCGFAAGHVGPHITPEELLVLRRETRPKPC